MTTQLRNPFHHQRLPWLANLHRNAFRSGKRDVSEPVKFASRVAFYMGRTVWPWPVLGTAEVEVGDQTRTFQFDSRNRMFSAVYFDQFAAGYEPPVMALIDALTPDDGVFFDIGSNWGYYSTFLACRPGFHGEIHAFEPWPRTYQDLASVVEQLGFQQVITCHNIALGEAEQTGSMHCGSHSGCARLSDSKDGIQVQVNPLDDMDLPTPHIMKVDTEGHEEAVFHGARRTLTEARPMIIFEHRYELLLHEKEMRSSLKLLESLNYRLFLPKYDGRSCHPDPRDATQLNSREQAATGLKLQECTSRTRCQSPQIPDLFACPAEKYDQLVERNWIDE